MAARAEEGLPLSSGGVKREVRGSLRRTLAMAALACAAVAFVAVAWTGAGHATALLGGEQLDISQLESEASSGLPQAAGAARMQDLAGAAALGAPTWAAAPVAAAPQPYASQAALSATRHSMYQESSSGVLAGNLEGSDGAEAELEPDFGAQTQALYDLPSGGTVAGPGMFGNAQEMMPLADCTGIGCVQRMPAIPATPGRVGVPEHTLTDIPSKWPAEVAQKTVEDILPAAEKEIAAIAQKNEERSGIIDTEIAHLSNTARAQEGTVIDLKETSESLKEKTRRLVLNPPQPQTLAPKIQALNPKP